LLIAISLMGMHAINNRLETIALNSLIKVELASEMLHAARERSIVLHRMVLIDDPFEQDELGLVLNRYGAAFVKKRTALIEMPLSEDEILILDKQGELTRKARPLQLNIVDLVADEELDKAKKELIESAMPAQDLVFDKLKKLIGLQKKYSQQASQAALNTYTNSRLVMFVLGVFGILLGILISRIFIRKISNIENTLHKEKEKALITFRSIGDAVITTDSSGEVEYVNDKAEKLIGLYSGDAVGKSICEVFQAYDADNKRHISKYIDQYLSGNFDEHISGNVTLESNDTNKYCISLAISPILNNGISIDGLVVTFHDITKSRELMQRIEYQATRDSLTGLLNRHEFERKVKQSLALYERNTCHAFCIVDLDRFKAVNDSCGHRAGDELLKQLSNRMKASMRKGDLMARIGGDEFAIFLPNIDVDNAVKQANKLLKTINNFRFLWEDKKFNVGASIGMVDGSPEVVDYDLLYHSADTACYIAKNEGRDRVHVISIEDSTLEKRKGEVDWVTKINQALDEDGFFLYGQEITPISLRVQGRQHVEILIRMVSDDRKVIAPMSFLPTAERYGLMQRIDEYVLEKTCRFISDNPFDFVVYAINLSGQTLSSVSAMENLIKLVRESEIPTGRLCLEVTETVAIANLENARLFMEKMQELGCYTALDDFGSGLSSFSYLKNLPLDYIKIDGVFVSEMIEDKASAIMVDAIHSVGKKLGLMTIAEYVENEETVEILREIGVDFAQGYFYSKPELCIPPFNSIKH